MTNLVLLSIQLVTNDVSHYERRQAFNNLEGRIYNGYRFLVPKKEVWALYTIGYKLDPFIRYHIDRHSGTNTWENPIPMLTLSNLVETFEPKQETNWVFTPAKP